MAGIYHEEIDGYIEKWQKDATAVKQVLLCDSHQNILEIDAETSAVYARTLYIFSLIKTDIYREYMRVKQTILPKTHKFPTDPFAEGQAEETLAKIHGVTRRSVDYLLKALESHRCTIARRMRGDKL